jgi:hypothetical protein
MKNYLGLFAVILAIGSSAFTAGNLSPKQKMLGNFYKFNGNPSIPSDLNNPLKYSLETNLVCPVNGNKLCEIVADAGMGNHPNLENIYVYRYRS